MRRLRVSYAHAARWLWSLIMPPRAATQTWLMLTFALFVGLGVVLVLGYGSYQFQRGKADARAHLQAEAERLAYSIEQAEPGETEALVADLARLSGLSITAISPAGITYRAGSWTGDVDVGARPEMKPGASSRFGEEGSLGGTLVHAAVHPPSGWIVRASQTEEDLYRYPRRLLSLLVAAMMLALGLTLLGSWVAAEKITAPLRAISESARNIGEGDFAERIVVETRASELQDLAQSLNRMSERYREKIDELERLASLQNEFIGNVSHEVRNPIFALSGYLEALASPRIGDDLRRRYAQKGLNNLQRLNNLFNDLIEIARLEYRGDLIRDEPFDFGGLVGDVAEMLLPKAEDRELTLEWSEDPVFVEADRNRMRQVMINLIDNAIAYTDEGSVRCRYRRKQDKVRIEVVDTGRGIPEDHLDRIFERFHRVDPDRSRKGGGTGLGLSIVKQIIQAHGEQIHVESTEGRGTRFWFELPYAASQQEAPPEEIDISTFA